MYSHVKSLGYTLLVSEVCDIASFIWQKKKRILLNPLFLKLLLSNGLSVNLLYSNDSKSYLHCKAVLVYAECILLHSNGDNAVYCFLNKCEKLKKNMSKNLLTGCIILHCVLCRTHAHVLFCTRDMMKLIKDKSVLFETFTKLTSFRHYF